MIPGWRHPIRAVSLAGRGDCRPNLIFLVSHAVEAVSKAR